MFGSKYLVGKMAVVQELNDKTDWYRRENIFRIFCMVGSKYLEGGKSFTIGTKQCRLRIKNKQ
jgi:hypothetical protein